MNWLQVIVALIGLLGGFVTWLRDKEKIDQAEATIIIENLKREESRVKAALDARNSVTADPDSLRNDKYNRRRE